MTGVALEQDGKSCSNCGANIVGATDPSKHTARSKRSRRGNEKKTTALQPPEDVREERADAALEAATAHDEAKELRDEREAHRVKLLQQPSTEKHDDGPADEAKE